MSDTKGKRYSGQLHRGPDHTAPYPVSRMAPAIDLVDLAREIGEADKMLSATAGARLQAIAEQVRALQAQARHVLEQTRRDQELHRARCNFKRIPGKTYHLYRKPDGSTYFSMLTPRDWRGSPPDEFLGSYRLENDMSWSTVDGHERPDETGPLIARLLGNESSK
jgi:hypothetical protein